MVSIDGKTAFCKVTSDSLKNVFIFGLSAAFIVAVGSHVRWLGVVLFGIDGFVIILSIGQTALVSILGVVNFFAKIATSKYRRNDFWWDLANAVQLIECGFHTFYFIFMYRHLFGASR